MYSFCFAKKTVTFKFKSIFLESNMEKKKRKEKKKDEMKSNS